MCCTHLLENNYCSHPNVHLIDNQIPNSLYCGKCRFNDNGIQIVQPCVIKVKPELTPEIKQNRFTNFVKAIGKYTASGFKNVNEEQLKTRLAICADCNYLVDDSRCYICGCKSKHGNKVLNKAKWASEDCPLQKWPYIEQPIKEKLTPPMNLFFSREGGKLEHLHNLYKNAHIFLICSGPSLANLDLSKLYQRGIITAGMNNVSAVVQTNIWFSVDDPKGFCDIIWRDPSILKFVPMENNNKHITGRTEDGKLKKVKETTYQMPNCIFYKRNKHFNPEMFLKEETVNWGNEKDIVDKWGGKGGRSVMFAAFKILHHLGFKRIYLLGCDFKMKEEQPYAFPQKKDAGACSMNNKAYDIFNKRFAALNDLFLNNGLKVFNCNPDSKCTAFKHLSYDEAIANALQTIPQDVNTSNMYGPTNPT